MNKKRRSIKFSSKAKEIRSCLAPSGAQGVTILVRSSETNPTVGESAMHRLPHPPQLPECSASSLFFFWNLAARLLSLSVFRLDLFFLVGSGADPELGLPPQWVLRRPCWSSPPSFWDYCDLFPGCRGMWRRLPLMDSIKTRALLSCRIPSITWRITFTHKGLFGSQTKCFMAFQSSVTKLD